MAPHFMSNQRCPATTTADEDKLVALSKQRVASGPQVSHGTAGGRVDRDACDEVRRKIGAYARAWPECTFAYPQTQSRLFWRSKLGLARG